MDGTLTVPTLDFQEMRRRVGILEGDILEVICRMEQVEQDRASRLLHEFEIEMRTHGSFYQKRACLILLLGFFPIRCDLDVSNLLHACARQALKDMKVMPGAADIAEFLDSNGVPRGIITRNVKESVHHFHSAVFPIKKPFNPALARCFTPPKPSPASLLHICDLWEVPPHEVVMVGDSPANDMACGNAAGAITILIDSQRRYDAACLPPSHHPTHHVYSMHEVRDVLQQHFSLEAGAPVASTV